VSGRCSVGVYCSLACSGAFTSVSTTYSEVRERGACVINGCPRHGSGALVIESYQILRRSYLVFVLSSIACNYAICYSCSSVKIIRLRGGGGR
jgi:hypothetical protein